MSIPDHSLRAITGVDAGSLDNPPGADDAAKKGRAWAGKLIPPAILALLGAVGWWSLASVERVKLAELSNALETTLKANVTAMTLWLDDQKAMASILAMDPRVQSAAAELAGRRGPSGEDAPRVELLGMDGAKRLRQILGPLGRETGHAGFVVVDRTGRAVAASEDESVGGRGLSERVDDIARVLAGKPAVSRPFPSDVAMPDVDGTPRAGVPMMVVAVPLRSAGGDVIAALVLRIRPEAGFTRILQVARFGESGETYAVDAHGLMLSQSRFDDQIRPLGLLGKEPGSRSMLGLDIRDPGGDMTAGFRSPVGRKEQPLTKMAAALAAGRAGVDVAGYNDYRGVPVVGAWEWLPEYHFGVTTEVDVAEAYLPLWMLRRTIGSLLGLLVLSYGATWFAARSVTVLSSKARWAERKVRQAELKARKLGQYTLEEKLGEGGMGAVYRASHAMLRRPTAIKLLSAVQPNMRELLRFEREVQLTSRLNHPNTITIFDFGRTPNGVFYYAMEYLPGVTLDRLVSEFGPLPEGRVIYILGQIAAALQEAHAVGLIHRDIKPANLMLCERGGLFDFVKVLDFGLVRETRGADPSLTVAGSITGTPQYLSPEAIRDANSADARSDLYAVGAVAYYLLTGRPAFIGASAMDILTDHLNRVPDAPSLALGRAIDPGLEALILGCLAKDPARRPPDASAFLVALHRCSAAGTWTNEDARAWWEVNKPTRGPGKPENLRTTLGSSPGPGDSPSLPMTIAMTVDGRE